MLQIDELYNLFLLHPQVTTDSRECPAGSIFFALKGESFDGNAYAKQALDNGCSYAVVDNPDYVDPIDKRFLLVDDALTTLQQLANHHRRQLGTTIIGVTGTNGKTTTKELIAAVLSKKYNVLYTQGNFNNHIGVPKTLLRLTRQHEMAVIEMGANHPGEIKTLVNIVEPNYGIITNVGKAHLLGFGSFEGVIRTKGELYDFLREHEGKVFINENNPHLMGIANGLQLIQYGNNGELIDCSPYLHLCYQGIDVQTHLIGAYNLDNALAAACIGHYFEVPDEEVCNALSEYVPTNNRSQLIKTEKNTLIVDAYNANPTSMKAALDNFHRMDMPNKMIIIGDMRELGDASHEEHVKILQLVYKYAFPLVWLVGEELRGATTDMPDYSSSFIFFADVDEVKMALEKVGIKDRTILIKGSNSMRLYTLVESL
ncbi:MAG: UDP-N-acetylmuramoyl-tripeptide--D-alanyl-D-alanine ligase [Bacteroidaceae bacterium]|nr:UDP-N-acetylmuramoyl-tripeptide--D-alanyl-D-alanine ligase [Bacteroidaceae bacterium]